MTDLDDLKRSQYVYRGEYKSNNQTTYYYPDNGDAEYGTIRYDYDGLPAQGIVLYDVVGYSIEDYSFGSDTFEDSPADEFYAFEDEIKEWIEDVLFTTDSIGPGGPEANLRYVGNHTFKIEDPYEGDEYTVKLDVENKRRVA